MLYERLLRVPENTLICCIQIDTSNKITALNMFVCMFDQRQSELGVFFSLVFTVQRLEPIQRTSICSDSLTTGFWILKYHIKRIAFQGENEPRKLLLFQVHLSCVNSALKGALAKIFVTKILGLKVEERLICH